MKTRSQLVTIASRSGASGFASFVNVWASFTLWSLATCLAAAAESLPGEGGVAVSYSGQAALREGSRPLGEIDSLHVAARFEHAAPFGARDSGSRLLSGFAAQAFSFTGPAADIAPRRLGSIAALLGLQHDFESGWSAAAHVAPGLYADHGSNGRGFGAPVTLRLVHATSADLQWVVVARADWRSGAPLLGAAGVRWQFAPQWTLALVPPSPRIEWAPTPRLTLFAGADWTDGTFRVAGDFGRSRGRPGLDDQYVDYREISAVAGLRWQISPATVVRLAAGQMLDRRFAFDDRDLLFNGDGAATVQLGLSSRF